MKFKLWLREQLTDIQMSPWCPPWLEELCDEWRYSDWLDDAYRKYYHLDD